MQRVLRDQRLKLADAGGGPAGVELPGEEGDRRLEPQLLKAAGERLGEVPGVRERRPAPQRQGLGHGPLGDEPLELGAKNQGLTDSPREHDSMNINKIADHILKANFEKLESNESIAQTSRNLEVIHQMRVAIRRLRAAMRTFKKILPSKAKKIRKKLLKVDHVLGEKRDLDVFCAFIRPIVKSKSTSYLKMARQSDRAQKQILAMFKSKYYASLIESLEHCKSISAKQNIRKVAENRIRKALSAVLEIASSLDAKAADKTLHKLRISVKKLRYICEFFEPIFSKSSRSLEAFIEKTRKIQDILGDHQDAIRGISMLIRYKSKFSLEEFLQIQKKYELKKMKTPSHFLKSGRAIVQQ